MSLFISFHTFLDSDDWRIDSVENFLASSINEEQYEETPLIRVLQSRKCSFEIVKLLLDYGADVNYRKNDSNCPLYIGLITGQDESIIEALLQKGGKLKGKDQTYLGSTYMCIALRYGASKEVIKLLLNAGSSPNACSLHDSALHCATLFPNCGLNEGVFKLLIDSGAELKTFSTRSPICDALMAGCGIQDIQFLIRNGIALDACLQHNSPWFCATDKLNHSLRLKTDIVKLIHEAGFPMNVLNENRWSPLQCALLNCNYQTGVIELMVKELGVQGFDDNGTLLHLAVASDYCKLIIVKLLVDAGLSVNQLNASGETPLHRAVMSESSDMPNIIKYFIEKGSAVDSKNIGGFTPLKKVMSCSRNYSLMKLLLEAGATIGSSILRYAFQQYNDYKWSDTSDIIKMFLKFSFLRNNDFQIRKFSGDIKDWAEWEAFAAECVKEVRKLDSEILNCKHSLRDLVLGSCKHLILVDNAYSETSICNFNQFLRIMANNAFHLFFGDISVKVDEELLKSQLQNRSVYTRISDKKKIRLDNDSLSWVMRYLSKADLLNMIIAYDT